MRHSANHKTFLNASLVIFAATIIGLLIVSFANAQEIFLSAEDGYDPVCVGPYNSTRSACKSSVFACYDACDRYDPGYYICEEKCSAQHRACIQAANEQYGACAEGNNKQPNLGQKTKPPEQSPEFPAQTADDQQLPEEVIVEGTAYVPALVDVAPTEIDLSAGIEAVERALFSLDWGIPTDSESLQAQLFGGEDVTSKITVEGGGKTYGGLDTRPSFLDIAPFNTALPTNYPVEFKDFYPTGDFFQRAPISDNFFVDLSLDPKSSEGAQLIFNKDESKVKIDIAPQSKIEFKIVDELKESGLSDEQIKYITSDTNFSTFSAYRAHIFVNELKESGLTDKQLDEIAGTTSDDGFFDHISDFFGNVKEVIITTVFGEERIQTDGSGGIVPIPVSEEGIAAFEKNTDYTFAYDPDTRVTSVEVYDGSVDVMDLNTGMILATVESKYGSPIARADIAADRTISETTAIPQSEWPAFVAKHQKSRLGVWPYVLGAFIFGATAYLAYRNKYEIMKIIKKQPTQ